MDEKIENKLVLNITARPDPTTGTDKTYLFVSGIAIVNGETRDIDIDTTVNDINKLVDLIEDDCCKEV